MEKKAENIVQNIGAVAETTSIFYNSIIKQVPKDVALVLTQHFMDLTINKRPTNSELAAAISAVRAAEARRKAMEQQQTAHQQQEKPEKPEQPESEPEQS